MAFAHWRRPAAHFGQLTFAFPHTRTHSQDVQTHRAKERRRERARQQLQSQTQKNALTWTHADTHTDKHARLRAHTHTPSKALVGGKERVRWGERELIWAGEGLLSFYVFFSFFLFCCWLFSDYDDTAARPATSQARDATERRSLQGFRHMLPYVSLSRSHLPPTSSFLSLSRLLLLLLEIVTKHIPGQTQLCNTYIYICTYVQTHTHT